MICQRKVLQRKTIAGVGAGLIMQEVDGDPSPRKAICRTPPHCQRINTSGSADHGSARQRSLPLSSPFYARIGLEVVCNSRLWRTRSTRVASFRLTSREEFTILYSWLQIRTCLTSRLDLREKKGVRSWRTESDSPIWMTPSANKANK